MIEMEILQLKEERNALILAHNYQPEGIQNIADMCGDSLELSRAAAREPNPIILFCGVNFMAETAAVISPEKIVILPVPGAYCPMAAMIRAENVRDLRRSHPDAAVVCYVNSTAEVKAESDICCTSANGVQVVNSLAEEEVVFIPDRNLAAYVARHTSKRIIPWDGYCYVHDRYTAEDVDRALRNHPGAEVLVHPECRPEVIDRANKVFSTSGMARYAKESPTKDFIIGTEVGMLYRLQRESPEKSFYPLSPDAICENMKLINLEKVRNSLQDLGPRVTVPTQVAERARKAIERMLQV